MKNWYVLKTKPQKEADVVKLLSGASIEVFWPQIREATYRARQKHFVIRPLFPNYLFVHVDFSDAQMLHMIKFTRGVSRILSAENKPVPLEAKIIAFLQAQANDQGVIERATQKLKTGDRIKVRKGMLKDLMGIIEKPTSDLERVVILIQLANYKMKAQLHWTEIEKI